MAPAVPSACFNTLAAKPSRKRKREPEVVEEMLEAPIIIQVQSDPNLSSADNRPRTLTPLLALPRPWLPFSFLEVLSPGSTEPLTHLFSGDIEALENTSQTVLIAKLELDRSYWAVERIENGIYALSRLKQSVKMKEFRVIKARANKTPLVRLDFPAAAKEPGTNLWWNMCKVNINIPQFSSDVSRPAVSPSHLPDDRIGNTNRMSESETLAIAHIAGLGETKAETAAINIQDSLETIRTQYLEALYTSKASLAYFAKAPLSRARAIFNGPSDSLHCISHLVDFLQSLIMGLPLMDKKYRESLPECIRSISDGSLSDEESNGVKISMPVKRAKKAKPRLGKSGLYNDEGEYVSRWWRGRDEDNPMRGSVESELAARVSSLRIRETELQMILILELLSLQESLKGISQPKEGSIEAPKSKRSRPRVKDVDLCLDLLIDRLYIWQSVGNSQIADGKTPDEKSQANQADIGRRAATDSVQNFWAGIIIPFYAPRLPGKCQALARKMAGSSSPNHSKTVKPKPTNRSDKQPTKDPKPTKKLSLHRVLSNEKHAARTVHFTPTSLQRPLPKRESSAKNATPSIAPPASRVSLPSALKLRQREVDLSVAPTAAKSTASLDSQLQGAIIALRKPDRAYIAGQIAQERKARGVGDRGKKSKRPQRQPPAAAASLSVDRNVQVKATPRKASQQRPLSTIPNPGERGRGARTPSPPPSAAFPTATPIKRKHNMAEMPLTPSYFAIPSSGAKPRAALAETPKRSRQTPCIVPSSGAKLRAFPPEQRATLPLVPASLGGEVRLERENERDEEGQGDAGTAGLSIYERLGWVDDVDELA
ncbi:MAG: hypothetical protein M1829_003082 [Trizodia sp. TS-e1964]|nr:MAG: hypothetical protein M1829_003082 [Trizodia sp. TS-e1964]